MPLSLGSVSKSNSIKCFKCWGKGNIAFQCPNKWNMVVGDDEIVESEKSLSNSEGESSSDCSLDGVNLIMRRLMSAKGKLCPIIINGGSSVNVASLRLVEKLNLPTIVHQKPYKLQWLNNKVEMYSDEIICDMVPMEVTDILLRRPWQYNQKVTHDEVTNSFLFTYLGEKVTLKPFSLSNIYEDLLKMKMKREKE
ncbi:hypothetical protein CR513_03596, partial [Mucuna pruriens]